MGVNPKSLDNLVKFNEMSKQRHKELSRKGGIASGRARRRRQYLPIKTKKFEKILLKLIQG